MTIALVTGGNRGLGLAIVRELAERRTRVILAARDRAKGEQVAKELRAEGLDVSSVRLDVTSRADIAAAADRVKQADGGLDILVNNAGVLTEAVDSEAHGFADVALFEETFATNVFGAVAVTEAFLPLLRLSPAGRIVNVSTTMGSLTDQADPNSPYYEMILPAYRSSKAALNSVTVGLAKKLAGTDIKVTSVCPGFVRTDLTPINRQQAPTSAAEAAQIVVTAATLAAGAESGTFVGADGAIAW